jgi:very-short-patch-repair endonuclease
MATVQHPDAQLAALAAGQFGAFTSEQALACGLTLAELRRRCARGQLLRAGRRVYVFPGHRRGERMSIAIAVLAAGPDAVVSHRSAARLLRLVNGGAGAVDVTVPSGRRVEVRGALIHRTAVDPVDIGYQGGIAVTLAVRTVRDLYAVAPVAAANRALGEALRQRLASPADFIDGTARLCRRGVPGAAAFRHAVTTRLIPNESPLEDLMPALFRLAGIPAPSAQRRHVVGGIVARVDFEWENRPLVVEADGYTYHSTPDDFERSEARANELTLAGKHLLRITHRRATTDPHGVIRLLRAAWAITDPARHGVRVNFGA